MHGESCAGAMMIHICILWLDLNLLQPTTPTLVKLSCKGQPCKLVQLNLSVGHLWPLIWPTLPSPNKVLSL